MIGPHTWPMYSIALANSLWGKGRFSDWQLHGHLLPLQGSGWLGLDYSLGFQHLPRPGRSNADADA